MYWCVSSQQLRAHLRLRRLLQRRQRLCLQQRLWRRQRLPLRRPQLPKSTRRPRRQGWGSTVSSQRQLRQTSNCGGLRRRGAALKVSPGCYAPAHGCLPPGASPSCGMYCSSAGSPLLRAGSTCARPPCLLACSALGEGWLLVRCHCGQVPYQEVRCPQALRSHLCVPRANALPAELWVGWAAIGAMQARQSPCCTSPPAAPDLAAPWRGRTPRCAAGRIRRS